MAIVTVCRTLNEERNIQRFCREYSKISDRILVVDGGSTDETIRMAKRFKKVIVCPFTERVYRGEVWRNPHGKHLNFMFDFAMALGADWIIYDDCDSLPNRSFKDVLPGYFSNPAVDVIMVRRLYLYKDEGYHKKMSEIGFAKWAWRAKLNFRASEKDPWVHEMRSPLTGHEAKVDIPSCLLHYSWPDDAEIARKAAFYHVAKNMKDGHNWHPNDFGGGVEKLPEWAVL